MPEQSQPLYMLVYRDLQKKMDQSEYRAGSILPSENELQKAYHVSRITVRRALSDLERDGRIERVRGKGTIVLPQKSKKSLHELESFSEEAKANGDEPTSIILKFCEQECSPEIAKNLEIEPWEKIFYLKRLRLINGRISGIFETYISQRFGLKLTDEDFGPSTSLYSIYEQNGIVLNYATETIEAIMATPELKRDMFMENDEPIFYRARTTYAANGQPIEFSKNYYKANGYKYSVKLARSK